MQTKRPKNVTLQFDGELHPDEKEFHFDISAVHQTGAELWLGSDETVTVERLSRDAKGNFAEHTKFDLGDFVDLPASKDEEVDIEGIAFERNYLWVTGSHSLKRKKVDGDSVKKSIENLGKMERETNRYLLARIPVVHDPDTGKMSLFKRCVDPENPKKSLSAARLFGSARSDLLVEALRDDPHIGPALHMPSKENGFDVEGIAVVEGRVLLGLRGPVLRGWAVILEIEPVEISDTVLDLKRIGPGGLQYRKHFLDLSGLGIRDLCQDGKNLLILAGPTMALDGRVLAVRWKNFHKRGKHEIVEKDDLKTVIDFEFEKGREAGKNKAEGICLHEGPDGERSLMVVYDDPGKDRQKGDLGIKADLFPY